jgi:triacylglycerol lipase
VAVLAMAAVTAVAAVLVAVRMLDGGSDPTPAAASSTAPGDPGPGGPGSGSGAASASTVPPADVRVPAGRVDQGRPGPVLLVPGYGGGRDALEILTGRIRATGRTATVLTLPGDGTGDFTQQVEVLDRAADAAIASGAPSVDVVGFSAGGVVTGLWLARADGADQARRVVTLGSPLHGTLLAAQGATQFPDQCPAACRQMVPGNPVLAELAAAAVGTQVPWLSLWTARDEIVTPVETSRLDGAVNVELQSVCPASTVTHGGLPTDPDITALVLAGLTAGPLTPPTACPAR